MYRSLYLFILLTQSLYSQEIQEQFERRMNSSFDYWSRHKQQFSFCKNDTIDIYEIVFFTFDSLNQHQKCTSLDFFCTNLEQNNIKKNIVKNSYIKLGILYESWRPNSVINPTKRNNYKLENLIIRDTSSSVYKINNHEFFLIYKSKAVVGQYHCSSSGWYRYYYPLRRIRNKKFDYLEIVKVIERKKITEITFLNCERVKFTCDQRMY
jgi:hypothetical protein